MFVIFTQKLTKVLVPLLNRRQTIPTRLLPRVAVFHLISQLSTTFFSPPHHVSLFSTACHCSRQHVTVPHHVPLFPTTCHVLHHMSLFPTTCHCSPRRVTISHHVSLLPTTCHYCPQIQDVPGRAAGRADGPDGPDHATTEGPAAVCR